LKVARVLTPESAEQHRARLDDPGHQVVRAAVIRVIFHGCLPKPGGDHGARDLLDGIAGAEVDAVDSFLATARESVVRRRACVVGVLPCKPGDALPFFFSKNRAGQRAQVPINDGFTGYQNDQAGEPFALVARMEDRQYDGGEDDLEYRQSFHKPLLKLHLWPDPNGYMTAIQLMKYRYGAPSC